MIYHTLEHVEYEIICEQQYNGSFGYTDIFGRSSQLLADFVIVCNTYFLNTALLNEDRAYLFAVPPGIHAMDVPYTFYNGPSAEVESPDIAQAMQQYFVSFTENGIPQALGLPTILP